MARRPLRQYRRKGGRRGRGRRRGFVAIPFHASVGLGTLADNTVSIEDLFGQPFGEDIFVISVDAYWALHNHTAGQGPIEVGYAHGALTTSQIAQNLDAELTDPDDIIVKEYSRRPVRKAGMFNGLNTEEVLNNGNAIRTTVKISIGDGEDLSFWAKNLADTTLTTGTVLNCDGTLFGRWQR